MMGLETEIHIDKPWHGGIWPGVWMFLVHLAILRPRTSNNEAHDNQRFKYALFGKSWWGRQVVNYRLKLEIVLEPKHLGVFLGVGGL